MIRRSRVFWWRISFDARRARLFRYLLMGQGFLRYLPPSKRRSAPAPAKASRVRLLGRRDLRS
jgi:hypothetical protein